MKTDSYVEERHPFGTAETPQGAPPSGTMWVFMEGDKPEAVNFLCPCGCGSECYTPLGLNHPRKWEYEKGPNGPTLKPSIRYTGGCKSHFNITNGKVVWHGDTGK